MGNELRYCFKCSARLSSRDFENGKAVMLGNNSACAACANELQSVISGRAPPAKSAASPAALKPSGSMKPGSTSHLRPADAPRTSAASRGAQADKNRTGLLLAVGGGAALVALGFLFWPSGKKDAEHLAVVSVPPAPKAEREHAAVNKGTTAPEKTRGEELPAANGPTGGILREIWTNLTGSTINDFVLRLKDKPDLSETLKAFDCSMKEEDNYGTRVRGYVHPPATGDYVFWVAGDDAAELSLSMDENPAGRQRIAWTPGFTARQQWNKFPEQQSKPIPLQAGRRYYIEALQIERIGLDHLSVGWRLPNGVEERPIPGGRLSER